MMGIRRIIGGAVCAVGMVGAVAATVSPAYADNGQTDQQILNQCGATSPAAGAAGLTCSFVQTKRTDDVETSSLSYSPSDTPDPNVYNYNWNCGSGPVTLSVGGLWLWGPGWNQTEGPSPIPGAAVQVFHNSNQVSKIKVSSPPAVVNATFSLNPGQWADVYEQSHQTTIQGHWRLSSSPAKAGPWATSTAAFRIDNVVSPGLKRVNVVKRQMTNAEYQRWCGHDLPDPVAVPAAPSAVAGDGQAVVTVPGPTTGGQMEFATVTAHPGGRSCTVYNSTYNMPASCTVTGLANFRPYTFTTVEGNAAGLSAASPPSASVTPTRTLPGVPTGVKAVAGNGSASVSWNANAPYADSYTVTASSGGRSCLVNIRLSGRITCPVTGLTNGTSYTFTITATNKVGSASAVTNKVTPAVKAGAASKPPAVEPTPARDRPGRHHHQPWWRPGAFLLTVKSMGIESRLLVGDGWVWLLALSRC
jgi:hypothetical protein